jgi:hypothetical protein
MSETFDKVCVLVERGEVKISDHGYDEMSDENILAREVLAGVFEGIPVEELSHICEGTLCARAAKGSGSASDPCRLGNSEGPVLTGGCCHGLQT